MNRRCLKPSRGRRLSHRTIPATAIQIAQAETNGERLLGVIVGRPYFEAAYLPRPSVSCSAFLAVLVREPTEARRRFRFGTMTVSQTTGCDRGVDDRIAIVHPGDGNGTVRQRFPERRTDTV